MKNSLFTVGLVALSCLLVSKVGAADALKLDSEGYIRNWVMLDADKGKVPLKKSVNVVVFKVINEQNSWQGAMRLLDKAGAPLKDLKIKLSPGGP